MSDISTWSGTGNLGGDAEVKQVGDQTVTEWSMAVNHYSKDKETTSWLRCSMWGGRGSAIAEYLRKGSSVTVTGEFSTRPWTDKQGQPKVELCIRVSNVKLAPKGHAGGNESQGQERPPAGRQQTPSDDIPF